MASFLVTYHTALRDRHYIRNARSHNYWVDFARGKLLSFETRYGTDFCLVISRADEVDDAYVIPIGVIRQLFRDDALDPDGRGWSATIAQGVISHRGRQMAVSRYCLLYTSPSPRD